MMPDTKARRVPLSLSQLAADIRTISRGNGWTVLEAEEEWSYRHKVPDILCLIHGDVHEALQAFQDDEQAQFLDDMADIVIRVLGCVGGLTDDFDSIVAAKLEANRKRGRGHGGKRV